jgi:DNA end-binding protein Ku
MEAMRQTGYLGVAKVAMHGREQIVVLRPSGSEIMLHTMYFADEIQEPQSVGGDIEQKPKELELAKKLIDTLATKFEPGKYHDEYRTNVLHLIEQQQKHETIKSAPERRLAPVVDIFAALEKSLAQKKGPAKARMTKGQPSKKAKRGAA